MSMPPKRTLSRVLSKKSKERNIFFSFSFFVQDACILFPLEGGTWTKRDVLPISVGEDSALLATTSLARFANSTPTTYV